MKKAAEKATNYADNFVHTISHKNDIMEAFFDGYSEAREDMLKDAEECELYWDGDFLAIDLNMAALGYSERDKVRLVVLKAEEE